MYKPVLVPELIPSVYHTETEATLVHWSSQDYFMRSQLIFQEFNCSMALNTE
jgi:hypothetical protein